MHTIVRFCVLLFTLVAPYSIQAESPEGSIYLDGGDSKSALILAHGRGKHPRWKVVEPLRIAVNDELGWHTLSLQLPNNDNRHWKEYADDFPRANEIFLDAIRFLKDEKGVDTIYLMGHSMGSRMASSFVSDHPDTGLAGLIIAGCRNNGGPPFDCEMNIESIQMPILDIWGGNDDKDSHAAYERREFVSDRYQQVEIPNANHKFEGEDAAFTAAVIKWLQRGE